MKRTASGANARQRWSDGRVLLEEGREALAEEGIPLGLHGAGMWDLEGSSRVRLEMPGRSVPRPWRREPVAARLGDGR